MISETPTWKTFLWAIFFAAFIVGCGPSQEEIDATATSFARNIFDTQTAQAPTPTQTSTPTPTPTITPTPTATPVPLSNAIVHLEDLPEGFLPQPLNAFDVEPGVGHGLVAANNVSGYVYMLDAEIFEIIVGQTELLETRSLKADWDSLTYAFAEPIMNMIAQVLTGEDAKNLTEIAGLEEIGNTAIGYTGTIGGEPPLDMDMVLFRRDELGAYTFVMYFSGDEPVVTIVEVARLLDESIIEVLGLQY